MKTTFDKCSQEDFDRILDELVSKMTPASVLAIDGVRELVQEELNNEVLDEWARQNPEDAKDWSEEEQAINQLDREALVTLLEGAGIQCYDNEDRACLATALLENVKDGTIEFSTVQEQL